MFSSAELPQSQVNNLELKMPKIRLQSGGAYLSDLSAIRKEIRANGAIGKGVNLTVTHPLSPGKSVDLWINYAFESNKTSTPTASLYITGFTIGNNTYQFNLLQPPPYPLNGVATGVDGSYLSLGYGQGKLPSITNQNLNTAIQKISGYTGAGIHNIQTELVLLIIATSEAIRFDKVANGIDGILGNTKEFIPDWDLIHKWDSRFIGS